jgi:hypothetical protein
MNSGFVEKRAEALAARLTGTSEERIAEAYRRLFGRSPDAEETRLGLEYLSRANWTSYARVLLSSNEMLFLP